MKKIVLLLSALALFLIALSYFFLGIEQRTKKEWFIKIGDVEGSAVSAKGLNYTLNFTQQNGLVAALNAAKRVEDPNLPPYHPDEGISQIMIYSFGSEEPIRLTPLAEGMSYFQVTQNKLPFFLQIRQAEALHNLMELTYTQ